MTAAPPAPARLTLRVAFGRDGDAARYAGAGWSDPEDRCTWSIGPQSRLTVPSPGFHRRAILTIKGWPHVQPNRLRRQQILVAIDGMDVGRLVMTHQGSLACPIPRRALAGKSTLAITLAHPDAARPSDFPKAAVQDQRCLGVCYEEIVIEEMDEDEMHIASAIRAILRKPPAERSIVAAPSVTREDAWHDAQRILPFFQSLGDDCEFGMFQHQLGLRTLGLFRFASIALPNVIRGLANGFDGIGTDAEFELVQYPDPAHDYMGRDKTYGILYHTDRIPGQADPVLLKAQELQRLKFMARKLMEDAALPDQFFVVKRKQRHLPEDIARLLAVLRRLGRSRLVWIAEAPKDILPGTAERLCPDLAIAYVDKLDVAPLQNISVGSWMDACRSAHRVLSQA